MREPIVFVYANIGSAYSWSPAVQVLSAVLKREGFAADLVHIHNEFGVPEDEGAATKSILDKQPELILYTATSFEFPFLNAVAEKVRDSGLNCIQLLGGIHATLTPESLQESAFDFYCIGEGEVPIIQFVKHFSHHNKAETVPGIISRQHDDKASDVQCINVECMDDLPFFDWEIMDTPKLLTQRNGWLSISFSRGCPFSCTFCVNQALMSVKGKRHYCRKRSVENAILELEYLSGNYEVKVFNFDDDLLCLDRKWIQDFCTQYRRRIFERTGITFTINARVDSLDEELIVLFRQSGCQEVQLGVESGDETLRNGMLGKSISDKQIEDTFRLLNAMEINTLVYLIIGIPNETRQTHSSTIDLMSRIQPRLIRSTFYVPIPKTPLYDYCVEHDLIDERKVRGHFSDVVLKYASVERVEILQFKMFLPWELNVKLGMKEYQDAIEKFVKLNDDELIDAREAVLEHDRRLSAQCQGKLHYSYFQNNTNYFVRNGKPTFR